MIIYDCSDKKSFEDSVKWIELIYSYNKQKDNKRLIMLVANKIDLSKRCVTSEMGEELAFQYEMPYFEVSAKTGLGVQEMIQNSADEVSLFVDTQPLEADL